MTPASEVERAIAALAHLKNRPRFTPGAAFYQVYHRPLGWMKRVAAAGPLNFFRGAFARYELQQWVLHRRPATLPRTTTSPALTVDLLTGQKFWAESIVVACSFARTANLQCDFHFFDDGSLGNRENAVLRRWLPNATLHLRTEIESRLARQLPAERYPVLHALRAVYVPIKKLTDLAVGTGGWRLYFDSDVLFFREPTALLQNIKAQQPCHLVDAVPSYGAPIDFLSEIAGQTVHPQINSGLYFRNVDTINWDFVEASARRLLAQIGYSYFIEQALAALLFSHENSVALDRDYLVLPSPVECLRPTQTFHHYVNQSRWAFYVNGGRELRQHPRL